jgi:predicted nucleic acid-binding protein
MGRWLQARHDAPLATSLWVHAEVASAVSMKVRMRSLAPDERTEVMQAWDALRSGMQRLDVDESTFMAAAEMAGRPEIALRAADALHLAVARAYGCTLVTLDRRMANAAPQLGLGVAEID